MGFYAYADVAQDVLEDPSSNDSGVELQIAGPHGDGGSLILSAADPTAAKQVFGVTELEHRDVSPGSVQMIRDAAVSMFRHKRNGAAGLPLVTFDPANRGKTDNLGAGYSVTWSRLTRVSAFWDARTGSGSDDSHRFKITRAGPGILANDSRRAEAFKPISRWTRPRRLHS